MEEKTIFTLLFIFVAIGITLHGILLFYLKKNHHDIWDRLGRPTLILNNSFSNTILIQKFLWKKEYLKVDDTKLRRIGSANHYFGIFYITFFIVSIIVIFPWSKFF